MSNSASVISSGKMCLHLEINENQIHHQEISTQEQQKGEITMSRIY